MQNTKGVGQNKNTQLQDEKVAVITQAIKQIIEMNQKITIRKIQELSGVAKSTVEKHYKSILFDLSQDIVTDNKSAKIENKVSETAAKEACWSRRNRGLRSDSKRLLMGL